jgi:hypothetical protein
MRGVRRRNRKKDARREIWKRSGRKKIRREREITELHMVCGNHSRLTIGSWGTVDIVSEFRMDREDV